jgi:guanyl-specific ribonuclease Sa
MRWIRIALLVGLFAAVASGWLSRESSRQQQVPPDATAQGHDSAARAGSQGLPPEAVRTLQLIRARGPFPYDRDGAQFQNREGRLPERPRGYYREYTVPTPGSRDRGARRIVSGGNPPAEFFYTDDHYRSFRRIEAADP